jgi:hypothetical protein
MSLKRTNRITVSVAAAMALGLTGIASISQAAPELTIRSEEAAHPRLVHAIHEMRDALRELKEAPDDFGGNKAAAIHDMEVAIHWLRRALYFRLQMDDAAMDRVQ